MIPEGKYGLHFQASAAKSASNFSVGNLDHQYFTCIVMSLFSLLLTLIKAPMALDLQVSKCLVVLPTVRCTA